MASLDHRQLPAFDEEYLHLVIPAIVKSCEPADGSIALRKTAVQTIDGLSSHRLNFSDHVSRIIHPLVRSLSAQSTDLRNTFMDTLCALVFQLGSDFAIFVPMIQKVRLFSFQNQCLTFVDFD